MTDFAQLRSYRRDLRAFCVSHLPSIEAFKSGISYLNVPGPPLEEPSNQLRHLTSTATCLESLGEVAEPPADLAQRRCDFASAALERPQKNWKSEGSAAIYCRCRALLPVISGLDAYDERIEGHLKVILQQLGADGRFGIGEADPKLAQEKWYPPNAFHTYWTLEILDRLDRKFPHRRLSPGDKKRLGRQRDGMLLWSQKVVGRQVALHNAGSTSRDTDQLVWALASVLRESREWTWALGEQDLIRQALAAIFSTQTEIGNWPTFEPLFHYRESGNAYCYIFETLSALLRVALRRDAGFLRAQLRPYCDNLARLWKYADTTAIPLSSPGQRGWSSGHRSQSAAAESWATASVYSFAQLLRRLVGVWTRETALQELPHVPVADTREKSEYQLRARGNTWSAKPVSDDLLCLFVNPARLSEAKAVSLEPESLDPDKISIQAEYSRSAILCGPPGTSKTTLARSIAGALAWNYVEIHASHFVSEGLPNVQKRADEIFSRLMELDRTVVLFDEIDELVREREEDKADVFGRFLTTSMLPKIAELWNAQKVLYFVATNHVKLVDPAILRSQRFDAIIFVPPPSFEVKVDRLNQVLGEWSNRAIEVLVKAENCESALSRVPPEKEKLLLPTDCMLAKFILLRWDQLEELAHRLRRADGGNERLAITADSLSSALAAVADVRLAAADTYRDYGEERGFARRDFGKHKVWVIEGSFDEAPTKRCVRTGELWWLSGAIESVGELSEECEKMGWRVEEAMPGTARISKMENP